MTNPQNRPMNPPPPPPRMPGPPPGPGTSRAMPDETAPLMPPSPMAAPPPAPTETQPLAAPQRAMPATPVRTVSAPPAMGTPKPPVGMPPGLGGRPVPPPLGRPGVTPPMFGRRPGRVEERSPGQPTLAEVVKRAFDSGMSDIHVGVGEKPRYRDRGEILGTDYPETDLPTFMSWLREVLSEEDIREFQEKLDFDGATQYEFARARINVFDTLHGPAMVMRLIPLKILTLEQLRSPAVFRDICYYHKGLILVTGPTGSGKSTTMAAMVDYINTEMPKHIITIEDPIEFVHKSKMSLIKQREVGINTLKFDSALKASLREDPDLILVGE
ncbi:MAG: ATPase, T2SS/T4P/T4SS family, partial [Cyanobacteria bacterium P01_H01_bin.121]